MKTAPYLVGRDGPSKRTESEYLSAELTEHLSLRQVKIDLLSSCTGFSNSTNILWEVIFTDALMPARLQPKFAIC